MVVPTFEGSMENESARNVTPLVTLFRAEVRALEAYSLLLEQPALIHQSETLRREKAHHADRAVTLHTRLREVLAKVPPSEGAWESITVLLSTGPMPRPSALITALRAEEAQLLADYQAAMPLLDSVSRRLARQQLVPEQSQAVSAIEKLAATSTI